MKASVIAVIIAVLTPLSGCTRYEPNWDSLDSRPLPSWYDESKFGIFIHWGVFSVPSFGSEWFWQHWQGDKNPAYVKFMQDNYPPGFTYADFASQFTAEFYNATEWVELFKAAGARYIVFNSKHHEGFTNWPSKVAFNWNSMDVGPRRDIVGELRDAVVKDSSIHFGLYHSLFEWFNPLYLQDKANGFKTQRFVAEKTMPELYELVKTYKPEVIWSDGDWPVGDAYWNSTNFLAWLYNESPVKDVVVVNDRWGAGDTCKHGGFLTCSDRYNPGHLLKRKWENAMTLDGQSWGYRRDARYEDYKTLHDLVLDLMSTVSCGGNLLMNIGPARDGRIVPIMEGLLRQIGGWLDVNGEAVYGTKPWSHQNDTLTPDIWYTSKNSSNGIAVYVTVLKWPSSGVLTLGAPVTTASTKVLMLGYSDALKWKPHAATAGIDITLSQIPFDKLPSTTAWVLKLQYLAN